MIWLLTIYILLATAHELSPIALSWMHSGYRRIMLVEWRTHILPPVTLFLAALGIAVCYSAGLLPHGPFSPWSTLIKVTMVWDAWHFAMQNYGVLRLGGLKSRYIALPFAFVGTAIGFIYIPPSNFSTPLGD